MHLTLFHKPIRSVLFALVMLAASTVPINTVLAAATVDVWYGDTQSFGSIGQPQPWVNILGNASDPGGVSALSYTLNGGPPIALSIGPDNRRLRGTGDFNIDIHVSDLNPGANTVEITAVGGTGTTVHPVTVNYTAGTTWPGNYTINWSALTTREDIQTVAQVVDGKWKLEGINVRTEEWGYDRLIGVGDMAWQDYEVLVPFTIHSQLANHGIGVLFRWNGHTDVPVVCPQPHCGWFPLGGLLWYEIGCLKVWANGGEVLDQLCTPLTLGVMYWFRGRVETNPFGGLYKAKIWQDGQSEPATWDVVGQEQLTDPQNGSMLLLVHMADVSFGPVTVIELVPPPNQPPVAYKDRVYVAPFDSVDVDVLANDVDNDGLLDVSTVQVIMPPNHGTYSVNPSSGEITYHHDGSVDSTDTLTYVVDDDDGLTSNEAVVEIKVTNQPQPAFYSDDFNQCGIDGSLWTFVNWFGDGWYTMVGGGSGDARIELSVDGNRTHDAWGANKLNETAHIMQLANDSDFEMTVKFNTEPSVGWQNQGLLVEQDNQNWARFDVFHNGNSLRAFMGYTLAGTNNSHAQRGAAAGSTYYLRVVRIGDTFTMHHSGDGVNWTFVENLPLTLNVSRVGIYAGNPVVAIPYTAEVDYFVHSELPLPAEDTAQNTLAMTLVGDGTVDATPALASYACGDVVALTATPDPGWEFTGWSGDASGGSNPDSITVDGPLDITATFDTATAIDDVATAQRFELLGARPNPFNPSTQIVFRTATIAKAEINIYDVRGRLVRRLLSRTLPPGEHAVLWDGKNNQGSPVVTGVYFSTLQAGQFTATQKLVLIK